MAITLSSVFASALSSHSGSSVIDQLAGGQLIIYGPGTGTPAGANEALLSNAVLATFTLGPNTGTAALTQSGGVIALAFPTGGGNSGTTTNPVVTAAATGTATFFRILNTTPASCIQGNMSSDFVLSSNSITSGDNVSITGTPSITVPVT